MISIRKLSLWTGLLAVLLVIFAISPMRAMADLEGITPTPTDTPSPTPEIPPPFLTATPSLTPVTPDPTDTPGAPPPRPRATRTPVPILPQTGEIPPDGPFGGLSLALLLGGILIGLAIGFGGRKLLTAGSGRWTSRFLSGRR
jgi:hypothetical protein